jgi:hypothetical protein
MSIYVLRSDNLVKIGFSDDLRARVGAIISGTPVPVEFVGHMPGGREVEAHLHSIFGNDCFSGEWFVETREMRILFDALLIPRLPEIQRQERVKKRTVERVLNVSESLRSAALEKWPADSHATRIDKIASELGWNRSRVKDCYYGDSRVALRSFEEDDVSAFREAVRVVARTGTGG